ncbi:MAG: hypothetical protein ACPGIA_11180 [Luteolibacter sp.]
MELIRITLAGFMALLVSMPFGLCGEQCHDGSCCTDVCHVGASHVGKPTCEDSCCSGRQQPQEQADGCGCNCLGECRALHFEQRDYAMTHSEVSVPDTPEQPAALHDLPPADVFSVQTLHGGDRLRAPPDRFARTSRQIIHCVFRW